MTQLPFPLPPAVQAGMTVAVLAALAGVLLAGRRLPSLVAPAASVITFLACGAGRVLALVVRLMSLVAALVMRGSGRAVGSLLRLMGLVATFFARGLGLGMGLALGMSVAYALWRTVGAP